MTVRLPVTVIVPVYSGLVEVQRCIDSVVDNAVTTSVPFELFVIEDGSPDDEVRAYVASLEALHGDFPLVATRNDENLGFVRTCNRGMSHASGDVVLLNADAAVTPGWLDRLVEAASASDIATVTPLTNFGSICTLPPSVIDAFQLEGSNPRIDECAAFVQRYSLGRIPEVISGVGFCMYITRDALDACGALDEETFGLGYGEEVDFCLRASAVGYRHLVEDRTYVFHQGGVSFSDRRAEGLKRSSKLLHARYPNFGPANRREQSQAPLAPTFAALELALQPRDKERPHVLQMLHSRPGDLGGTEKHFWRLVEALVDEIDFSVLHPDDTGFVLTTVWRSGSVLSQREYQLPGQRRRGPGVDDPSARAALQTVLDMYEFDAVHIQNIINHSLAPLDVLASFEGAVICSVRDLYLACPHHWLLYKNIDSCGIPEDLSLCSSCLPETRNQSVEYLVKFRSTVADRLLSVDHWVFASESAKDFFLRVYDVEEERMTVIPHGAVIEYERPIRRVDAPRVLDEPLRLAFVGMGWAKKGLPVVNEVAERLAGDRIEVHHFGVLKEAISDAVIAHGPYDNNVLPELLHQAGIHVVFLPGPFLETFGHVMTEALVAGLPIIGHQHGALGERIRRDGVGWTIDPADVASVIQLIEHLEKDRLEVLRTTQRAAACLIRSVAQTAPAYADLYRTTFGADPSSTLKHEEEDMSNEERLRRELRAMATLNRQLQARVAEMDVKLKEGSARQRGVAAAAGRGTTGGSTGGPLRDPAHYWRRGRAAVDRHGLLPVGIEVGRRAAIKLRRVAR